MMSRVKRGLSLFLVAAVSLSAATVVKIRHDYYGVCSPLKGLPGFLLKAGLLQAGTCKTVIGGSVCSKGSACTVAGKTGVCRNDTVIGGTITCTCVPNVSQP